MRLQRGVPVAGMDPEIARELANALRLQALPAEFIAARLGRDEGQVEALLVQLEADGFIERSERVVADAVEVEWSTTVRGGALAGASFLKPMTRQRAQLLLDGVIERAHAYNTDPAKPLWIQRINLFGSLLDESASDFGDIDLQVVLEDRPSEDPPRAKRAYARASGRRFSSFLDELFWAETEALRLLKNHSGYISIHTEDITRFTDRAQLVYDRAADSAD